MIQHNEHFVKIVKNLEEINREISGIQGSDKFFSIKREIIDGFFKTSFDMFIVDPEGEYSDLVDYLHGQVVKISSNSTQYINPLDINIKNGSEEEVINTKSDFLISLCELIIGGRFGLEAEEKIAIDMATRQVYDYFFTHNPNNRKMPILADLLEALRVQGDVAARVANALEMYVSGSQNLFNNRTNVEIKNRLVYFDIKELSFQLKKMAMLILQDIVWNRVLDKKMLYYIDDIDFYVFISWNQ